MKTILVASDFSKNANNALKYANAFAAATEHQLLLMNVYSPSVGTYSSMHAIIAEETQREKSENHKKLNALLKKHVTVPAKAEVAVGEPLAEIMKTCKSSQANFIVVGTHGASGMQQAFFGSHTTKVIAKAEIPVLAIPTNYRHKKIETIVYATDLKNAVNELKVLVPIAKLLDAAIEIVYLKYGWEKDAAAKLALEKKIKSLSYKKIAIVEQKATIEKTLIDQLKSYLRKRKPDMLAMFPSDKSWFDKIFTSSKTEELAYVLKVPLLSIRKKLVSTE